MDKKEIKMQLLKEFGVSADKKTVDFCREAYKFLIEDDPEVTMQDPSNLTPASYCPSETVAVDLGLPSGNLWADRNVGAESPEDYGAFFSWGNVEPHFPDKGDVDWGDNDDAFDYKFTESEYEKTPGYQLKDDIDAEHDAATANLGEPWCMPTDDDFQELYDNCDWTCKTVNGVNGYLVVSKINGNSIFFPCSGYGNGSSWLNRGSHGGYWSRSLNSAAGGRRLHFGSSGVLSQSNSYRYYGFPVRPVQNTSNKTK